MTQYPYPPPTPYATPGVYQNFPPARPVAVTAIGIIGIVWGAIIMLCNSVNLIPYFGVSMGGPPNPVINEVRSNPALQAMVVSFIGIRTALALVALIGGIGALGLHRWGRSALLLYGWGMIVITLVDGAISPFVMFPILDRNVQPGQEPMLLGMKIGIYIGVAIGLIYPIFALHVMTRKHVKDAFNGVAPAPLPVWNYGAPPYPGVSYPGAPYPPATLPNPGQGPYSQ